MNLRILLLKTGKFPDFLRCGCRFSHSIMVNGKKELSKKLCFMLARGILCIFQVE